MTWALYPVLKLVVIPTYDFASFSAACLTNSTMEGISLPTTHEWGSNSTIGKTTKNQTSSNKALLLSCSFCEVQHTNIFSCHSACTQLDNCCNNIDLQWNHNIWTWWEPFFIHVYEISFHISWHHQKLCCPEKSQFEVDWQVAFLHFWSHDYLTFWCWNKKCIWFFHSLLIHLQMSNKSVPSQHHFCL